MEIWLWILSAMILVQAFTIWRLLSAVNDCITMANFQGEQMAALQLRMKQVETITPGKIAMMLNSMYGKEPTDPVWREFFEIFKRGKPPTNEDIVEDGYT